jgi:putative FmdB family regulatory protein
MPKYIYQCEGCSGHFEIYHGMTEDQDQCPQCKSEHIHRVPQMPFVATPELSKGDKVGKATNDAIEANREVLQEMKKQINRDFYHDDN